MENDIPCVDIQLRSSRQLFDGRDPAPFRERDLDEHAVEYLLAAAEELPAGTPMMVVFHISEEPKPYLASEIIVEAVTAHFEYELNLLQRHVRDFVRQGQVTFCIGILILIVCLSSAGFLSNWVAGSPRYVLREGLIIIGWVAMWRPIELLLYGWWPFLAKRRRLNRVLEAEIVVRHVPSASGSALPTVR